MELSLVELVQPCARASHVHMPFMGRPASSFIGEGEGIGYRERKREKRRKAREKKASRAVASFFFFMRVPPTL